MYVLTRTSVQANEPGLVDRDRETKERATAIYFLDRLALRYVVLVVILVNILFNFIMIISSLPRAGNEQDEGEEADTVGCCSLKVKDIGKLDSLSS